jgi:hypothetical protein
LDFVLKIVLATFAATGTPGTEGTAGFDLLIPFLEAVVDFAG